MASLHYRRTATEHVTWPWHLALQRRPWWIVSLVLLLLVLQLVLQLVLHVEVVSTVVGVLVSTVRSVGTILVAEECRHLDLVAASLLGQMSVA